VTSAAVEEVEQVSLPETLARRESEMEIGPFYGELRKGGLEYGAKFANVRELWLGKPGSGEAFGRVTSSPLEKEPEKDPFVNAVLLDGCLQVFGAALDANEFEGAYVPATIHSMTLHRQLPAKVWSHVTVEKNQNGRAALARIRVLTDEGELLADIEGLELRQKASLTSFTQNGETSDTGNGSSGFRSESRDELLERMRPMPRDQRVSAIVKWLAAEVKDTMGKAAEGLEIDDIEPTTAFLEIGLDSLLVTELQRRIQEKLDFRFKPMQGLDYQSIESLAEFILEEVLVLEPAANVPANGQQARTSTPQAV
jgi:acyl carrier protein